MSLFDYWDEPGKLTIAAELSTNIDELVYILLEHPSALAREGAVLGLGVTENTDNGVAALLRWASKYDPSPAVREAAEDIVDDLDEPFDAFNK